MKNSVYIIGPTFGLERVFPKYGYTPFTDRDIDKLSGEPEYVVFTGGTDISPSLYGEAPMRYTQMPAESRDKREVALYHKYKDKKKLGICRGAQLLNVLNGGSLWQHVDNHTGANHFVDDYKGRKVVVCSVHHQMMRLPKNTPVQLLSWSTNVSSQRLSAGAEDYSSDFIEPEVVFFPEDKALCFQAHPEFGPDSCTDYFFTLMKEVY